MEETRKVENPMQIVLDFIVSGGASPQPDHRCMIRMVRSLAFRVFCKITERYVYNPLVYYYSGTLSVVVQQIHVGFIRVSKDNTMIAEQIAGVYWYMNGCSMLLRNKGHAKLVRRYLALEELGCDEACPTQTLGMPAEVAASRSRALRELQKVSVAVEPLS